MYKDILNKLVCGINLDEDEAVCLMDKIMTGGTTDAQIAALITALRIKGETIDEITGFTKVMRKKATPVKTGHRILVDTCGTGGDGSQTFNISTTAAFVVAATGTPVAKHGNRSVSSRSGSADVLEALGVNIDLTPEQVGECIDHAGIGFLFAPVLHGAMKYALGPRREIGIRTVFNILGPLTNPAGAQCQVLGVYDANLTEIMAGVLNKLGTKSAFVVHGAGGLDEISILGETKISEVRDGKVITYYLDPQQLGFKIANADTIRGGSAEENACITRAIFDGEQGPKRDIVVLNAAAALVAAGTATDMNDGIRMAANAIKSGATKRKLNQLIEFTRNFADGEEAYAG